MGRASSAKKIARASRAAGRPGVRRSLAWPATIAGVVVMGVALILFTVSEPDPPIVHPTIGDHWHAAYGIDHCGTFLPPLNDRTQDATGIHTHGDGLIHIHPFSSAVGGNNANLATWGLVTGLELTDTSIKATGIDVKDGDDCNGRPGKVQVKVWTGVGDTVGRLLTGDLSAYAPPDQSLVTIAFVPEGDDVPRPPDSALANLDSPVDVVPTTTTTVAPTTTSAPG